MQNPNRPKPSLPPGSKPAAPAAAEQPPADTKGRVIHDSRGMAVWDWVKESGRHAIESTSRLLKKLDAPELKVEQTHDEELRIVPDAGPGGGYDPYNQKTKPKKPGGK
jgi:hypothetical protein